jgi:hypothetical protein
MEKSYSGHNPRSWGLFIISANKENVIDVWMQISRTYLM